MALLNLTTSIADSIKLRDLGVGKKMVTFSSWILYHPYPKCESTKEAADMAETLNLPNEMLLPAYTSEELMMLLPPGVYVYKTEDGDYNLAFHFPISGHIARLSVLGVELKCTKYERCVDALAALLIFIIENNIPINKPKK
jgi:hypothetical protein